MRSVAGAVFTGLGGGGDVGCLALSASYSASPISSGPAPSPRWLVLGMCYGLTQPLFLTLASAQWNGSGLTNILEIVTDNKIKRYLYRENSIWPSS